MIVGELKHELDHFLLRTKIMFYFKTMNMRPILIIGLSNMKHMRRSGQLMANLNLSFVRITGSKPLSSLGQNSCLWLSMQIAKMPYKHKTC